MSIFSFESAKATQDELRKEQLETIKTYAETLAECLEEGIALGLKGPDLAEAFSPLLRLIPKT